MDSVPEPKPRRRRSLEQLLRDCLCFGIPNQRRKSAKARLEEKLGEDMAQQLVTTLAVGSRGRGVNP